MVLELQAGLVLAVLGLLGLPLLLFERSLRSWPSLGLGFFLGVFLYLVVHDLTDALLLEGAVRSVFGAPTSFSLVVLGFLLGGGAAGLFLRRREGQEVPWPGILVLVGLVLALHSTVDGFVVGSTLQGLTQSQVLASQAVVLQVVHRALEGGVAVVLFWAGGVRTARNAAAVLYVGLPFALTTPLAPLLSDVVASALAVFLATTAASVFLVLLLVGLWPALSPRWRDLPAGLWLLVGFLVALLAHALAH